MDNGLSLLKEVEHTTKTEIIKKAIVEHHARHITNKSPYEVEDFWEGMEVREMYHKQIKPN